MKGKVYQERLTRLKAGKVRGAEKQRTIRERAARKGRNEDRAKARGKDYAAMR